MALILSCLTDDPLHTRRILDQLRSAGWSPSDITVLHPDTAAATVPPPETPAETGAQAAAVGGGGGAVAGGIFGWLVGYGVLALPAALLGAALGSAAGAAIGASADEDAALRRSVLAHYGPRITGSRSAILVTADDAKGYDVVMRIFRQELAEDIQVVGKGRLERATKPAKA